MDMEMAKDSATVHPSENRRASRARAELRKQGDLAEPPATSLPRVDDQTQDLQETASEARKLVADLWRLKLRSGEIVPWRIPDSQ